MQSARKIDITELMLATDIPHQGSIEVNPRMSGLEIHPKDDWLYLGLLAIRDAARGRAARAKSVACIGSANGIDSITILRVFPQLETLYVTDIFADILPQIRANIEANLPAGQQPQIHYLAGSDCEPIPAPVDFIYGNLPLIMVEPEAMVMDLATTTLTDAGRYLPLSQGAQDPLHRWSLLSQLGFLLSAKAKLNAGGTIVTLIGGRIPYEAIEELFRRAGLRFEERYCAFKRQSDAQFIKEYAEYEARTGVEFFFYDYDRAAALIREQFGVTVPDIVPVKADALKPLLGPTRLNAEQAYAHAMRGEVVGHIAFAFETYP